MEHILNAQQRSTAWLKFLLMFVVTTSAVIAAVYFGISIPGKDNAAFREKEKNYQSQADNEQEFIQRVDVTKRLIDSMANVGQVKAILDLKIANQLNQMQGINASDSTMYSAINNDTWMLLNEYSELTKKWIDAKGAAQQVQDLQNKLMQSQKELEATKQSLDICRSRTAQSNLDEDLGN